MYIYQLRRLPQHNCDSTRHKTCAGTQHIATEYFVNSREPTMQESKYWSTTRPLTDRPLDPHRSEIQCSGVRGKTPDVQAWNWANSWSSLKDSLQFSEYFWGNDGSYILMGYDFQTWIQLLSYYSIWDRGKTFNRNMTNITKFPNDRTCEFDSKAASRYQYAPEWELCLYLAVC